MLLGPEVFELLGSVVRDHSGITRSFPARGADFTMLVSVHESVDKSEGLINITAYGEVRDTSVSEDSFSVDDEGTSEGNSSVTSLFDEGAIASGDALGHVSYHGDLHGAKSSLVSGLLGVLSVSEVGVDRASNNLASDLLELRGSIVVVADLSGADEGEVKRPEEEHDVLALELAERDLLELVLPPGLSFEIRGGSSNSGDLLSGLHYYL